MDRNQEREAQVIVNKGKSEIRATRAHMLARAHIFFNKNKTLGVARTRARFSYGKVAASARLTRATATFKTGGLNHA